MPVGDYEVELGKAKVVKEGNNVTIVAWGNQVNVVAKVNYQQYEQCLLYAQSTSLRDLLFFLFSGSARVVTAIARTYTYLLHFTCCILLIYFCFIITITYRR